MTALVVWLAGYAIAAAIILWRLWRSDFHEACGLHMVVLAAVGFGALSWLFVSIALIEFFLHKFGGEG